MTDSQCKATTKSDRRCRMRAQNGSGYCRIHAKSHVGIKKNVLPMTAGALVGILAAPGFIGAIVGGLAGIALNSLVQDKNMLKKKAFVSFDYDNDKKLKDFIIGQSRNSDSPFEVTDTSLKEAAPERDWEQKAEAAIRRSDIVVVMVGPKTSRASGVLKEVAMARKNNVKIVQIIGYKDGNYNAVPEAGRLYHWNWENLKNILS